MRFLITFLIFLFINQADKSLVQRTQIHMNTFVTLSLEAEHEKLFDLLFERVHFLETEFSTYKKDAKLSLLNTNKKLSHASNDLIQILKLSKKIQAETYGYFNIAIGSLTKDLFRFGMADAKVPTADGLAKATVAKIPFAIDSDTVLLKEEVKLDLGGIAKGYTVDVLRSSLEEVGVEHFTLALSGDIYCKESCKVAIASPFEKNKTLMTLELEDSAISTSGNYERFIKSKKHNHLINPKTKQSQQEIASITLVSQTISNAKLDAYATALAVMPESVRKKFLQNNKEIDYLIVYNNRQVFQSHGFKRLSL
ncbi:MAG: FAD:protein FMN transferase [Thiovulaceae bacterium]|nr:FAD:protein FMN transferase [Sulfurimonadaceae bacterium]